MRWAVLGVALAGCYSPHVASGAPCMPDVDNCPADQSCETTAAGSFCTAEAAMPDGGGDGTSLGDGPRPDAGPNCFGTGLVTNVCLQQAPAGNVILASGTIDTAMVGASNCNTIVSQSGGPSLCLIAADTISIPSGTIVRAQGANPLLLIGATRIDIAGELHVDSKRGGAIGAGAQATCASGDGVNGNMGAGGGGGGGSFGTAGANGGKGENSAAGTAGGTTTPTAVRGGCAGGNGGTGDGGGGAGAGGAGGGAVYMIAGAIMIEGSVDASGAGGGAGTSGTNSSGGGGGGGAGGLIGLDAPTITATGALFANGGGGGGGGGNQPGNVGSPGSDPATYQTGGTGGNGGAGGGGKGGTGFGLAAAAQTGTNFSTMYCGGGGGGGGAGVIRVFQASPNALGANVSPAAQ